ncbi:hypothetical protein K505DRAFT_360199 [Melanomma pulvis-pyrius CBS 109.77]|uniref:Uncharacterized protein n=1 Tax=Melanomma pulvis-pyrius CBS 109.77 TaxID=1314802 RepID=A0A6A6XG77_9PLEO|nr:hypothetical protein K505DRAFT_360199 [Melanomma pulvis-pyrius CBS 109.77]
MASSSLSNNSSDNNSNSNSNADTKPQTPLLTTALILPLHSSLHALLTTSPNVLQYLTISISLPPELSTPHTMRWSLAPIWTEKSTNWLWEINLSALKALGRSLQRVQFSINYPHFRRRDNGQVRACARAFEQVQREMVRLANKLVREYFTEHLDERLAVRNVEVTRAPNGVSVGKDGEWRLERTGLLRWMDTEDNKTFYFEQLVGEEGRVRKWYCQQFGELVSVEI